MANPENTQGMTIAQTTYDKLKGLKKKNETFDDVVSKLIAMDQKYNFKPETIEYEYITYNISKIFRVVFDKNTHKVEYYSKGEFSSSIRVWNDYPSISDEDKELFIEFIVKETSFNLLRTIENQIDFGEFIIRKVG